MLLTFAFFFLAQHTPSSSFWKTKLDILEKHTPKLPEQLSLKRLGQYIGHQILCS